MSSKSSTAEQMGDIEMAVAGASKPLVKKGQNKELPTAFLRNEKPQQRQSVVELTKEKAALQGKPSMKKSSSFRRPTQIRKETTFTPPSVSTWRDYGSKTDKSRPDKGRSRTGSRSRSRRLSSMRQIVSKSTTDLEREVSRMEHVVEGEEREEMGKKEEIGNITELPEISGRMKRSSSKGKLLWKKLQLASGLHLNSKIGGASNKMVLLEEHHGIPIKETMKVLYSVRRLKFVWEIFVLTFTLGLFYFITTEPLNRRTAYEQELTIIESIQDEEFQSATYKKNFLEIRSEGEFWEWVEGPLMSALYSADPSTEKKYQDYMNSYLRLVGGLQIRQFRVSSNSCYSRRRTGVWGDKLDTKDGSCFASYGIQEANRTQPPWATGVATEQSSSNLIGHWGHCGNDGCPTFLHDEVLYGYDGYYIEIPPPSTLLPFNKSANVTAQKMIESLRTSNFFDRGTRAVAVEAVFYNVNTEIMTNARYVVEQFPAGLLEGSSRYRHARLSVLSSKLDVLRILSEGIYCILMVYQFQRECKRMMYSRPVSRYFSNPFSYLELTYFLCHGVFAFKWYEYVFFSNRTTFDVNRNYFVSYFDMTHELFLTWQWAGFAFLSGMFKLMRFFSLNRRVSVMWQAIYDSAPDLVAFMFSFALLLLGFAFLAHMMWGHSAHTFTTVYNSITSLFRYWIDDFPFANLYETNPDTYYAFFVPFALLMTLIVQNVFVAIIINAFSMIHAESKEEHWKHDLPGLIFELRKRCGLMYFHVRVRCKLCVCWYGCRHILCCCSHSLRGTNVSRWSLDDLLEETRNYETAKQLFGTKSFNRYVSWSRELEFYHVLAIAAREARRKTMSGGNLPSLYEYFRRAYREHPTDIACYMSLHELCAITKPRHLDRGHARHNRKSVTGGMVLDQKRLSGLLQSDDIAMVNSETGENYSY
jgi:hypothetical protein